MNWSCGRFGDYGEDEWTKIGEAKWNCCCFGNGGEVEWNQTGKQSGTVVVSAMAGKWSGTKRGSEVELLLFRQWRGSGVEPNGEADWNCRRFGEGGEGQWNHQTEKQTGTTVASVMEGKGSGIKWGTNWSGHHFGDGSKGRLNRLMGNGISMFDGRPLRWLEVKRGSPHQSGEAWHFWVSCGLAFGSRSWFVSADQVRMVDQLGFEGVPFGVPLRTRGH
jgi:hypothetical protein